MRLDQLIELLESYRDEIGGDAEVRLMTQESWPFENVIQGVVSSEEMAQVQRGQDGEEDQQEESDGNAEPILYLVEGGQICYGSKLAWEVLDR